MKHVFVETNFLIELARPVPTPRLGAAALHERARRGEIRLHLPWCSINEAKRTLSRIITEDFAFRKGLERYAASRRLQAQVRTLLARAKQESIEAQSQCEETVDGLCASLDIIPPSAAVVSRTLLLYPVKSLPPFDEMVLGAVLTRAEELLTAGERELWFCSLNKNDFGADRHDSPLSIAYRMAGLAYLENFDVPA